MVGQSGQASRARAADAAARAASPEVSQPMPANRHEPTTSVESSSAWSSPTSTGRPVRLGEMAAGVVAAGLAEPAEGGRVAPGLGGEVAAEAEHVAPPSPALVGRLVAAAQLRRGSLGWSAGRWWFAAGAGARCRPGPRWGGRRRPWWRTSRCRRRPFRVQLHRRGSPGPRHRSPGGRPTALRTATGAPHRPGRPVGRRTTPTGPQPSPGRPAPSR